MLGNPLTTTGWLVSCAWFGCLGTPSLLQAGWFLAPGSDAWGPPHYYRLASFLRLVRMLGDPLTTTGWLVSCAWFGCLGIPSLLQAGWFLAPGSDAWGSPHYYRLAGFLRLVRMLGDPLTTTGWLVSCAWFGCSGTPSLLQAGWFHQVPQ